MRLSVEVEQEDGRWLGEVRELPGVLAYRLTRSEAISSVQVLAPRVLADRIEHGESLPQAADVLFSEASGRFRVKWCQEEKGLERQSHE